MACFGQVWYYFSLVFALFYSIISVQFSLHAIANEIRNLSRLLLLVFFSLSLPLLLSSRFYSFQTYAHSIPLCRFLCTNCVFLILDRWLFPDRQIIFDAWTMEYFAYLSVFLVLLFTRNAVNSYNNQISLAFRFFCYSYVFSLTLLLLLCAAEIYNSNLADCCTLFCKFNYCGTNGNFTNT